MIKEKELCNIKLKAAATFSNTCLNAIKGIPLLCCRQIYLKRKIIAQICLMAILTNQSCTLEIDTKVKLLDSSNPPVFELSGSGYLSRFVIWESLPNFDYQENPPALWMLLPNVGTASPALSKVSPITYGKIPQGFTQITPKDGSPPSLLEGKLYTATANTNGANSGYLRFTVREGKVVELPQK